jgi:hypothetical protein
VEVQIYELFEIFEDHTKVARILLLAS